MKQHIWSQSTLFLLDECSRKFWRKVNRKPVETVQSELASSGRYWHDVMAAALRARLPVVETCGKVWKLDWLTRSTYFVESRHEFEIDGVQFVAIPDFRGSGKSIDWKSGQGDMDDSNIPARYRFQGAFYAYDTMVHFSELCPGGGFSHYLGLLRWGRTVLVQTFTFADLPLLEQMIRDKAKHAESVARQKSEPKPEPGSGCAWCDFSPSCPASPVAKLASPDDARRAALALRQAEAATTARRKAVQGWAAEHGAVDCGDGFEYGQRRGTATTIKDDTVWAETCKCGERHCQKSGLFSPDVAAVKKAAKDNPALANAVFYEDGAGTARWQFYRKDSNGQG